MLLLWKPVKLPSAVALRNRTFTHCLPPYPSPPFLTEVLIPPPFSNQGRDPSPLF